MIRGSIPASIPITFRIRTTSAFCATVSASCAMSCARSPWIPSAARNCRRERLANPTPTSTHTFERPRPPSSMHRCTCRVGDDELAVVDSQLRVHGVAQSARCRCVRDAGDHQLQHPRDRAGDRRVGVRRHTRTRSDDARIGWRVVRHACARAGAHCFGHERFRLLGMIYR